MRLLKKFYDEISRMWILSGFMLRLSLQERIFISFFVMSLMFISTINIIFNSTFQNVLAYQMSELKYAFKSWYDLAVHMGIAASSIFIVLVISVSFLPIIKHAFRKDYLEIFLSKPVRLGTYILSMFFAFLASIFILTFFWWIFVLLTVFIHAHVWAAGSVYPFFCVFAFGAVCLAGFMFFYSIARSPLASVFTLFLSVGSIVINDDVLTRSVQENANGIWMFVFEWSKLIFSSISDWVALAFDPESAIDVKVLVLRTILLMLFFILAGTLNFRRHLKRDEFA